MSDPFTAMAIGSALGGALGMFGGKDDNTPEPPTPPAMPNLPEAPTPEQADYNKSKAKDKERRRNMSRSGRGSTILTGSLGSATNAGAEKKSLLG